MAASPDKAGFTLIELSVVLVIIGLIVGGILVGQDLIKAAEVRSVLSQIEKYNSAANTFYGKYQALPGDMPAVVASQFGFAARGLYAGEGDGNGVLEGITYNAAGATLGSGQSSGENWAFWRDLSEANLVEGDFHIASPWIPYNTTVTTTTNPTFNAFFPPATIGRGNFIYVWSGGTQGGNGINYFGISVPVSINTPGVALLTSTPGLTAKQAYSIDSKTDDGFPQSGRVMAHYCTVNGGYNAMWAGAMSGTSGPTTAATPQTAATCYDNNNVGGGAQQYSLGSRANYGAGTNCALSFQMQGAGR